MSDKDIFAKVDLCIDVFKQIVLSDDFKKLVSDYSQGEIPRIILSGVGKNWYICEKIVKTYLSLGIQSEALDCVHALHGDLGMLMSDEKKLLIFVSKSGNTEELVKLVKIINTLRKNNIIKNIETVGFYMNTKENIDTTLYDRVILLPEDYSYTDMPEFDSRNIVPSLSINTMQLTLDYFGVQIYEARPKLVKNYVYNHLSGANGRRLGSEKLLEELNKVN